MALRPGPNEQDHSAGPLTAPVTLVEYGDYQCPHCRRAHYVVQAVQRAMGDDLCFIFRNFPLSTIHPDAVPAAWLAEAAAAKGRFWAMHDMLYEHQDHLDPASLHDYGLRVGLAVDEIETALAGTYRARVDRDFSSGIRSGVNGTPTFFVDGQRYDDSWDFETLQRTLRTHAQRLRTGPA